MQVPTQFVAISHLIVAFESLLHIHYDLKILHKSKPTPLKKNMLRKPLLQNGKCFLILFNVKRPPLVFALPNLIRKLIKTPCFCRAFVELNF